MRKALVLAAALAAVVFMSTGAYALQAGAPAPEIAMKSIDGGFVSLTALKGKTIILVFWASWCPPCRDEMPILREVYKKYKPKGVEVIGVSLDASVGKVRDFLEEIPVGFPIIFDEDGSVSKQYGVHSIPTTFVIDKAGIIRTKYFIVPPGELDEYLDDLLKK